MAKRVARIHGNSPYITGYDFDEEQLENLHIKHFDAPSEDWAKFVLNNRNRKFTDFSSESCNHDSTYDLVIGPIANDDLPLLFRQFSRMPVLRQFDFNIPRINETLEGIYSTVILRDILERNKATDQALLRKVVMFLADNIGCVTSPNSIGNVLSAQGDIDRGKSKGKQHSKTLGKNYIIDLGFRNMLLGYRDADRGHILENIVLSMDKSYIKSYDGIKSLNIIDFLLGQ